MLSYLHSFHAGSRADVHKHRTLAALLIHLTGKPRPITYMETHAGRGLYDLSGPQAEKTGEAKDGIRRLQGDGQGQEQEGDPYLRVVETVQERYGPSFYPGSPWIAQHLLRAGDCLHLMELHPAEYPALKRLMRGTGAHIHHRDGYEGVLALLPPTPRRGVVLIDPSYEVKGEYTEVAKFIPALYRKWPEAVVLLWYPLLAAGRHMAMIERLSAADLPETENHETVFAAAEEGEGMLGSGLFLVNKPFGFPPLNPISQHI
ncbi:MAG: 23S rRNA (adenine(2030)-N(6))-methyltransferase RlmJ [Rhodospirillales bacterium]|nr:23S rRNA (adenine(2030)-N(6))-methyltransferase RlmJ [Rhodospirillales bacterium]